MGRMDGKVVLVVGSSPNIGGTIAHFMAREGAKIACNDLAPEVAEETADFLRSRGYGAAAIPGDSSNEEVIKEVVAKTVETFGHVDTHVNMAGDQIRAPLLDLEMDTWWRELTTFTTTGMLVTREVARSMKEKGKKGGLIHIISSTGHRPEAGNPAYATAKAALLHFARGAAMDLAHLGIRVNTITPYFMEHNLPYTGPGLPGIYDDRYNITADDYLEGIPLLRFPRATDLANAAVFLASDESEFITACDLQLDGGVRYKYYPWKPGRADGLTVENYMRTVKRYRYGEPVEEQ